MTEQMDLFGFLEEVEVTEKAILATPAQEKIEVSEVVKLTDLDFLEVIFVSDKPKKVKKVKAEKAKILSDLVLKSRSVNLGTRGIYLQDKELLDTVFQVGTFFDFIEDAENKKVTIISVSEKTNHTVSKRKMNGFIKPVIDIRKKSALACFDGCSSLSLKIFNEKIEVVGVI